MPETEFSKILVVSHNTAVLRPLWSMGESRGWKLEIVDSPWEAVDKVQSGATPDLLLLDLPNGEAGGLHILRWMRRLRPALPIVLIGHPGVAGAREESMCMGARDYLESPFDEGQLEMAIRRNLCAPAEDAEMDVTSDDVEQVSSGTSFIGISPVMRKLRAQAALLAETSVPVLIVGESGSGRETTARLIHKLSVHSEFEFAKVNCAALPADLLEKELFGYEKADAAAPRIKRGKLELCGKGTIFFDDVSEIPLSLQDRLLEVLKSGRFIRPGSSTAVETEVRILAACATDFERAVSGNRFRESICGQLSAYTILVPPLRERKEEIPFLARHFMHRLSKHYGLSAREFSSAILAAWQKHDWPGNLRELEHSIKRYLMVGDKELAFERPQVEANGELQNGRAARSGDGSQAAAAVNQQRNGVPGFKSLRSLIQSVRTEAERSAIAAALEKTGWNRKAAARLLKVSYRTVLYKIQQYHMTSADFHGRTEDGGPNTGENGFREENGTAPSGPAIESLRGRSQESM